MSKYEKRTAVKQYLCNVHSITYDWQIITLSKWQK